MVDHATVLKALERVIDPELGLDIVNLGLVYEVEIDPETRSVMVEMTLTSPACPLGPSITSAVERVLLELPDVERAKVSVVWNPPWDPSQISPLGRARLGIR